MMLNDSKKERFLRVLKSRALYICLSICVLAAGLVGISAMDKAKAPTAENSSESMEISSQAQGNTNSFHTGIPEVEYTVTPAIEEPEPARMENNPPVTQAPTQSAEVFENLDEDTASDTAPVSYQLPLSGVTGKDYSMGVPVFSKTMSDYRTHNGVDFKGEKGQGVKAIAEGMVTKVKKDAVWGNSVQIDHGGGVVSTVYGLADEGLIGEGSAVQTESVIGVVGSIPIEAAEDDHIHLEIRVNGTLADPLELMGYAENTEE